MPNIFGTVFDPTGRDIHPAEIEARLRARWDAERRMVEAEMLYGTRIIRVPKDSGPGSFVPAPMPEMPANLTMDTLNATMQQMLEYSLGASNRPAPEVPEAIPMPSRDMLKREPVKLRTVEDMNAQLAAEAEKLLGYGVLRKKMGLQSPLLAVLHELKIEPFDLESVNLYKLEMLEYAKVEAARMDAAEGVKPGSVWGRRAYWNTIPLDRYTKPVPEFALDSALRIIKACPAAEFEIEELEVVKDPFLIAKLGTVRRYIEVWGEPKFERVP